MPDDDVEEIPPGAILDFDDPDVGIEFDLARQIGLDRGIGRRPLFEARGEGAVGIAHRVEFALRRRTEQIRGAVEPVDADEHGAGLLGAAPAHDRGEAFDLTAAQIGGNPERGFQTHRSASSGRRYNSIQARDRKPCYSSGWPVMAASSLTRLSETRPVTGSLRSRSNFSIACAGRVVEHAGRLDLAVAVIGQNALHRRYARRRRRSDRR